MKLKRFFTFAGIAILVLVIIGIVGMIIWATTGTLTAQEVALAALESTDSVTVTQDQWIVFEPTSGSEIGLVFYPGGLVEAKAYAPIMHQISEKGVLVIITPMPLNLAIFNTNAANDVLDAYPQIPTWIIAGHSLGGAAASIFAENHPERIDAIAFWDSYPADSADLSDNAILALSIFGTMDQWPNTDNFNEKRHLLPSDAIFVGIEGANHAQFGDYGEQRDDVVASISLAEQHERVAEIMLDFIDP
ncbi:MAG: alpha/beta fold hydrolase [Anaerolineales bacterium]|jgi:hypothetical protein